MRTNLVRYSHSFSIAAVRKSFSSGPASTNDNNKNVYSVVPLSLSQKHLHSNGIPLFDTQNVINKLKHEADFHDEEAKALTVVMHELMKKKLSLSLASRSKIESDALFMKAHLEEMRLDIRKSSMHVALDFKQKLASAESQLNQISQELDMVVENLKTDVSVLLNNVKSEHHEERQKFEMEISKMSGYITQKINQFRTDLEGLKLQCMYTFTGSLLIVLALVLIQRERAKNNNSNNKQAELPVTELHIEN